MKPAAYIETSVVSYLTARPSRDIVVAGNQQVTREWWETAGNRFSLVASPLVLEEAARGDAEAARARLQALEIVAVLEVTLEARRLARTFLAIGSVPQTAAVAAAHGVDYLLTWNFRHLANAVMRPRIERACREAGYEPPAICSPYELMEVRRADDVETRPGDC
ncbi:type II toxin-antitoxin system VapC family toxin [Candidatus Saccharibacteria bacterium]|nr:type II toxin-antitoxin system VapC family toxin [Candidatus Saccharibacteria bacterium]